MTSEPDSPSRRRPPTIDLTATEVKDEQTVPETGLGAAAKPRSHGGRAGALGALVGAAVVAAIGGGLWLTGVVPPRNAAPTPAPGNGAMNSISAQLNQIQAALAARPAPADGALNSRVTALDAQIKVLGDQLVAVNRRFDGIAMVAQSAREHADAAAAAAQSAGKRADETAAAAKSAAQNSVRRSDLDALANRITALESTIKTLSDAATHGAAASSDRAARGAVAAEALRSVVDRGAPFTAELAAVKAFGADQNAVATLAPFAAGGVPSDAALAHELAQLVPKLQPAPAAAPSSSGGFLGSLESHAKSLVRITPVGVPPAGDPSSALARLNDDAARADIAAALKDIASLAPSAEAAAEPWVQQANARNAALAASRRIAAAALAELASTNTQ
jgi:hypothetical protein